VFEADRGGKHITVLCNVANLFTCCTSNVGKEQVPILVGLGKTARSLWGAGLVGHSASVGSTEKAVSTIVSVITVAAWVASTTIMVMEANARAFGAAKTVDCRITWGGWREALD
jgi:hypothetical protein